MKLFHLFHRPIFHTRSGQSYVFVAKSIRQNSQSGRSHRSSGLVVYIRRRRNSQDIQEGRTPAAQVNIEQWIESH